MDAFRRDQYTDFTALETSLVDHLPGNQNSYGWGRVRMPQKFPRAFSA